MSKRTLFPCLILLALSALLWSGCHPAPALTTAPEAGYSMNLAAQTAVARQPAVESTRVVEKEMVKQPKSKPGSTGRQSYPAPGEAGGPAAPTQAAIGTQEPGSAPHLAAGEPRMIIKDAQVRLLVKDTDRAIDGVTQMVGDLGGYIISPRTWYQTEDGSETNSPNGAKYATLTLGVPVERFETALQRLHGLSLRVLDENATGQDVTSEYVDLESNLKNLQATRDRIRGFLDQATTVEEALKVNEQLAQVEGQIDQVQGRMKYLSGRAAFSTITVDLQPDLQTPTPTVTPTRTPTVTPTAWSPADTYHQASGALTDIAHGLAQAGIWLAVVVLPLAIPPLLIILGISWLLRRRREKTGKKTPSAPAEAPGGPD
jgi:hypothetical protein